MTLLVERLGPDRAAAAGQAAGGQRVLIPDRLEDGGAPRALERLFGRDLAVALVLHFPGAILYIPHGRPSRRVKLSDVVRLTIEGKLSANAIASILGCSERTVYGCRARARREGLLTDGVAGAHVAIRNDRNPSPRQTRRPMSWGFQFFAESELAAKAKIRELSEGNSQFPATIRDAVLAAISPAQARTPLIVRSSGHIGGTGQQTVTIEVTPITLVRDPEEKPSDG